MKNKIRFGLLLFLLVLACGFYQNSRLNPEKLLMLLNQDRSAHGLNSLTLDPNLNLAAMAKAEDMLQNNYFAHTSPKGKKPWDWFAALGYNYSYAGENLAVGFTDPKDLENSWMASSPHRANILSPYYSDLGLAIVNQGHTTLVVQFFGSVQSKVTLK